jgi:mono/diheme cytochrome c family protein
MLGPGVVLLGLTVGLPAAAQDPAAGRALAEQWCASCHAVAAGAGGSDRVPSFERIVEERDRSEEWLSTWLSVPHESMPSFSLSRQEFADLVAYLESLHAAE